MFLPKPFTAQIDVASATAAFLPLRTDYEKAKLEPLAVGGGRERRVCSARQMFLCGKAQTPNLGPEREAGKPRWGRPVLSHRCSHLVDLQGTWKALAWC